MAKTDTARDLLVVALQDLHDAERAVVERHRSFCTGVSTGLESYLREEGQRAAEQGARLEKLLAGLDAPATDAPNIWLRAALDDAARDYQTIVPGTLRDIALVGAFRKAKQSERVSYETAIGLAQVCGQAEVAASLLVSRNQEASADEGLASLLQALLAQISV